MVFNNYNTFKVPGNADCSVVDIWQFLPEAHHGLIIVTTRLLKISIGCCIKVDKLEDICDSLQILSNASHCESVIDGELFLYFCRCNTDTSRFWCCWACQRAEWTSAGLGYSWCLPWPGGYKLCWILVSVQSIIAETAAYKFWSKHLQRLTAVLNMTAVVESHKAAEQAVSKAASAVNILWQPESVVQASAKRKNW